MTDRYFAEPADPKALKALLRRFDTDPHLPELAMVLQSVDDRLKAVPYRALPNLPFLLTNLGFRIVHGVPDDVLNAVLAELDEAVTEQVEDTLEAKRASTRRHFHAHDMTVPEGRFTAIEKSRPVVKMQAREKLHVRFSHLLATHMRGKYRARLQLRAAL